MRVVGLFLLFLVSTPLWGNRDTERKLEKRYYQLKTSDLHEKQKMDSIFIVLYTIDYSNKNLSDKLSKDFLAFTKNQPLQGKAYLARALYYSSLTDYKMSNYYCKNSILHLKKEKDSIALTFAYQLLVIAYERTGNFDLAIQTSEQALDLAKKLNNYVLIANTYKAIGLIMSRKTNYQMAKVYHVQSLAYYQKSQHEIGVQATYTNLGISYKNLGQYDSAFYYQKESLALAKKIKSNHGIAFAYNDLGNLYMISNKLDSALYCYNQSVKLRQQMNEKWELGYTYNYLGELYCAWQQKDKSIDYLRKAENLAYETGNVKQLYETYEQLSLTFAKFKQYDSAFYYNQLFQQKKDSLTVLMNNLSAEMLITNYEFDKKQQEIMILQNRTSMQALSINSQRTWLWIAGFGIVSLCGFILLSIRNKKLRLAKITLENQQKEELLRRDSQEKILEDRKRISRELHDNIGANLTVFKEMITNLEKTDQIQEMKQLTEETIQELRKSVWLLNHEKSSLEEWVIRLKEYFRHIKKVEIFCHTTTIGNPVFHASILTELFRVIQEGVNNALKHASCSEIKITIRLVENSLNMTIEDNGSGLGSEAVMGFGLQNMRERISSIHGKISFDHVANSGTKISVNVLLTPL